MSRYTGPRCKICRREGTKLFLKGERCFTDRCALDRRNYGPGEHGQRRARISEYRVQLREKQKVRFNYGVSETQFKRYYEIAKRKKGITGENLLLLLERRLDNIVYRMGFASSRSEARQLIGHGHIAVNGRKTDIPSFMVKEGDQIEVREKGKKFEFVKTALENAGQRGIPEWLEVDEDGMKGKVKTLPERDDLPMEVDETLIVEFYSK
ncbi:MAG: 30S ribosomal protein S4 [Deltaproteobacteria bacterium]|nr:MAG: 30S ribosomal protein S4 [Deltaproteobacteria bacterium]